MALQASQVLPKDLIAGTNYRVRETVASNGLVNKYDLDTVYGAIKVETTTLLIKRIGELRALSLITQLQGTDAYINAATKVATGPIVTVVKLVSDPNGTVNEVASGIGRFFCKVKDAMTSDNPYQGSAATSFLGQASYKREYAYRLGVDPYSPYEPLKEALNDLAWTATAGGLTVKVAFMFVPEGAGVALGLSGAANSFRALVRDKTPAELSVINENMLMKMDVPPSLVQAFMQNSSFDPQEQTLLVGALAGMQGVKNPGIFIQAAASAKGECLAVFYRTTAQFMEQYQKRTGAAQSFVNAGDMTFLKTANGKVIGIFPFDYVAWTPSFELSILIAARAIEGMPGVTGKEFWVSGKLDPVARKALEKKGWKVEEQIELRLLVG